MHPLVGRALCLQKLVAHFWIFDSNWMCLGNFFSSANQFYYNLGILECSQMVSMTIQSLISLKWMETTALHYAQIWFIFFIFSNKNPNKQWTHMLCVKLNTSDLRKQSGRIFSIIFWVVLLLLIALFTFGLFGWESSRIWKFYNFFLFFLLWKIIFNLYNKENGTYVKNLTFASF